MVAGFAEELDDDDLKPSVKNPVAMNHNLDQSDDSDVPEPEPRKTLQPVVLNVQDLTSSSEDERAKADEMEKEKEKEKEKKDKKKVKNKKGKPADLVVAPVTEDLGFGAGDVDNWLNSPELEPKVRKLAYILWNYKQFHHTQVSVSLSFLSKSLLESSKILLYYKTSFLSEKESILERARSVPEDIIICTSV